MGIRCKRCGKEIDYQGKGRPPAYCEECRKKMRDEYMRDYSKRYRMHKPKSAWADKEYYAFYKFLETLTEDELRFLFCKRKKDAKRATGEELRRLRTEMSMIRDALKVKRFASQDYQK